MSKKWLLGACGALLAGGLFASTAQASFLLDFQVVRIADGGAPLNDSSTAWKVLTGGNATTNWNTIHGLTGTAAASAKSVPVLAAGQTMRVDVFATVLGTDAYPNNDGFVSVLGNIVGNVTAGRSAPVGTTVLSVPNGQFVSGSTTLLSPGVAGFNNPPAQIGVSQPIGNTGSNDWGSLQPTSASAQFNVIAAPQPAGTMFPGPAVTDIDTGDPLLDSLGNVIQSVPNPNVWVNTNGITPLTGQTADSASGALSYPAGVGIRVKVGEFYVSVSQLGGGATTLNWEKWLDPQAPTGPSFFKGATWIEDGQNVSPGTAPGLASTDYTIGNAITLATVPEPASLSVLALGALGLLARRRR